MPFVIVAIVAAITLYVLLQKSRPAADSGGVCELLLLMIHHILLHLLKGYHLRVGFSFQRLSNVAECFG